MGVCTKERKGVAAKVLMAPPIVIYADFETLNEKFEEKSKNGNTLYNKKHVGALH